MKDKIVFNNSNYPKSYASIRPGFYRLRDYLDLSGKEIKRVENQLWNFILEKAELVEPIRKYKDYNFLNSGWEWSVFVENDQTLIKVPAGIFPEVNTPKYLDNTKFAYQKILQYFSPNFVAKSKFRREDKTNIFKQEYIGGKDNSIVGFSTKDKILLKNINQFLDCSLDMLINFHWLPDFDIKRTKGGFTFRNIIIEKPTHIPKIIDFTAYYDVYRLYPQREEFEIKEKARRIKDFKAWISSKI